MHILLLGGNPVREMRKRNGIIFSIKGIAFFLKVWYNTDKENGLVVRPGSTCGGDVPRHFVLDGV